MIRLTFISILIIGNLIGCNNNKPLNEVEHIDEVKHIPPTNDEFENENMHPAQDFIIAKMDRLPFTEFNLQIKYDSKKYEIKLERKSNGHYDVMLNDELKQIKQINRDAFDHIYPMLNDLSISNESDETEIIQDILNVFNLEHTYDHFQVKITFNDGYEYQYEDRK